MRGPFWPHAGALAASILPISIGYQFAHYLTALLVNGQYAAIALSDPFALGWFASEDRMHRVTTSFLSNHAGVTLIWNLQAAGIVIGHIVAVLVAHLVTLRLDTARRTTLLSQAAAGRPDGGLYFVRALAALDAGSRLSFGCPMIKFVYERSTKTPSWRGTA